MPTYRYAILGGGMVAGYAAKELAAHGLKPGELGIISSDSAPPYERPPLSKGFLAKKEPEASLFINDDAFYRDHGIDLQLDTVVDRVDTRQKRLLTRSGPEIEYRKLLIATGATVRTFDLPGAKLDGIRYLRTLNDSKRIQADAATAQRAVVVGSGFIGMEVASVLAQQGVETTLLFPGKRVWERLFTPQMSAFFRKYYGERGVAFKPGERVASFQGQDRVTTVVTESGRQLPADLVVGGIGVEPATGVLDGSGLTIDNGVVVNEYLETSASDVYAAGDVANYRDVLFEKQRRTEHWDNAVEQGQHVAHVLLGERTPFVHVPYFFSDVFDLSYEFWGDTDGADQAVTRGDVEGGAFSVWWLKGGRLTAAFVMNRPDDEREVAPEWIREQHHLTREQLQDESRPLGQSA